MPALGRLAPRARAATILLGLIGLSAVLASGNVELNRVKLSKCFPNTNDVHRTAGAAAEATAGDGNSDAAALVTESFAENEQEQEAEQEQDDLVKKVSELQARLSTIQVSLFPFFYVFVRHCITTLLTLSVSLLSFDSSERKVQAQSKDRGGSSGEPVSQVIWLIPPEDP